MATNDSRIYTKLGDDGSTGLLFGGRVSKSDPIVEAIGAIDETVASLGMARAACDDGSIAEPVLAIQRDLFVAGADLMANPRARDRLTPGISELTADMVSALERMIDDLMERKPLRPVFVVPGANPASAALDMARCQVRRAERQWVACHHARLAAAGGQRAAAGDQRAAASGLNEQVGVYLNRVSDLLYVLARQAAGDDEEPASHEATGV